MRINVYAEELTSETEVVTKVVTDPEFGERTFYGIRVFLKSPSVLHHSDDDDDRSAITFWIPWTKNQGNSFTLPIAVFNFLLQRTFEAQEEDERAHLAREGGVVGPWRTDAGLL